MKKFITRFFILLSFFACAETAARILTHAVQVYDIEMTRYALLLKARSADPLLGHVHRPNSRARLMGVEVAINADGFRGKNYPLRKGQAYRIILLGDSLTLGWGVAQDRTFAQLLERRLSESRATEVLNFGTGNYNAEQSVRLFETKGLVYRPDRVLLCYFINDAEMTAPPSSRAFLGHSRLISLLWSRGLAWSARFSRFRDYAQYYRSLYAPDAPGWMRAREAILRLKKICESQGIRFAVVLLPELHALRQHPLEKEYGLVRRFLDENGIACIDARRGFANETDPYRFWVARDDAHPNADAHALIAGELFDGLSEDAYD